MSESGKGRIFSPEHKKNLSIANSKRRLSEAPKDKIRKAHLGRKHTKESIENMINSRSGYRSVANIKTKERRRIKHEDLFNLLINDSNWIKWPLTKEIPDFKPKRRTKKQQFS